MVQRRRREVLRLWLMVTAFAFGATAFGASKLQRNQGGTWLGAYFSALPIVGAMALVFAVGVLHQTRLVGDWMTDEEIEDPPTDEMLTWDLNRGELGRWPYALVPIAGVGLLLLADDRDPGVVVFFTLWLGIGAFGIRDHRRKPTDLALHGDLFAIHRADGTDEVVPVADITSILWPSVGNVITIRYRGGVVRVPRRLDAEDLVLELRQRNHAIEYDGYWPPSPYTQPAVPNRVGKPRVPASRDAGISPSRPPEAELQRPPSWSVHEPGPTLTYVVAQAYFDILEVVLFCVATLTFVFVAEGAFEAPVAFVPAGLLAIAGGWLFVRWRRSPKSIDLGAVSLAVHQVDGVQVAIALDDITEVRWPARFGFAVVRHRGGVIRLPKQTDDLDDLVSRLRSRRRAIAAHDVRIPARRRAQLR